MIFDHRTYDVIPGKLNDFLKVYEEMGFPLQRKYLGEPVGWYVSMDIGELNQVVHIWKYDDLSDRAAKRAQLAAEPGWGEYLKAALPLLQKMQNKIVSPAPFFKP